MAEIIDHDFGKKRRDTVRLFSRLMRLAEEHEDAILKDPLPFLKDAGEEIARLRRIIDEAQEALRLPLPRAEFWKPGDEVGHRPLETVCITRVDYDRLRACARIVKKAAPNPPRK